MLLVTMTSGKSLNTDGVILPVLARREEIVRAIREHRVVVVCGATGSGKTTQLPQMVVDAGLHGRAGGGGGGRIAHTQPRRLAARAVAARIAEERGVRLGGFVGSKVRFSDQTSRETVIKVMTDGILLAELSADPMLKEYSCIIIDEAHERSLNVDFLLGYLRTLLRKRDDLKVIVTSATIDPRRFSDAFGGEKVAPVIEVSGRTFPVEIRYRPFQDDVGGGDVHETNPEAVADAVEELFRPGVDAGDVLVFVPGEREIALCEGVLKRRQLGAEILPLFSRLSTQDQDRIFHPVAGKRRVILATNVAETSLTVPGIRHVVDTGLARVSRYDAARKVQKLPIEPISRASCDQRSGRCGRVAPGVCIRLYSEESYRSRPAFTDPEIRRTNLASVILRMKSAQLGELETFLFLDAPEAAAIKDGYETLFELGAIDAPNAAGKLTQIGERMSQVPLDPRIARALLAAEKEQSLHEVIILAAALEIQDPRQRPMGRQEDADRAQQVFRHEISDFLTLLKIYDQFRFAAESMGSGALNGWCRDHFLSAARMREWVEMVHQLRRVCDEMGLTFNRQDDGGATANQIHRALLTGLISNVSCREGDGSFDYRSVRGGTAQIFPGSVLFKKGPKWIMAAEMVQTTRLYARTVAKVEVEWIEELAGHMFKRQVSDPHLDAETGEPSAWERVMMGGGSGIVVVPRRRAELVKIDKRLAREVFVREGLAKGKLAEVRGWEDVGFVGANARAIAQAKSAEAKLRRRDVLAGEEELAAWFDERLGKTVCDPASLKAWLEVDAAHGQSLELPLERVLRPEARRALEATQFPEVIEVGEDVEARVEYALAPGKETDGVTVSVPLLAVPKMVERAEWLVPGMMGDVVLGLLKNLPKAVRADVEKKAAGGGVGELTKIAEECAGVMTFGEGRLSERLSETLEVLFEVKIEPSVIAAGFSGLPAHLRMRVVAVDEQRKRIDDDRDVAALVKRLEGRIRKAQQEESKTRFAKDGITTWSFGALPQVVEEEVDGAVVKAYPAVLDAGASASITLVDSQRRAQMLTAMGVRRLFAIAVGEEMEHHLLALPEWSEMCSWFKQLGTAEELKSDMACLIAERAFMGGLPMVKSKLEFEERLAANWGRIATSAREVGEVVAKTLEPRARIAHRFSGGTPRLWVNSVADMREQAAYLMPRGFLLHVPWERLRHYPRYVQTMRERLFALREDGSGVEKESLAKIGPYWKRFTGWVAAGMSAERAALEDAGEKAKVSMVGGKTKIKAPLPQTRRMGQTVNVDAGEWAMEPGRMPPLVEQYRWGLEEFRVTLFAVEGGAKGNVGAAELDAMWKKTVGAGEASG